MDTKTQLHQLIEHLSEEEAQQVLKLMESRQPNPLLDLDGILTSGRTDGADRHDKYLGQS